VSAPDSTYDTDLMLRIAKRATARTVHRRPDEAAPPRPQSSAPAQPTSK
jgi:hypothetical protein